MDRFNQFDTSVQYPDTQRGDTPDRQRVYVTILALQFKDELPEIVTAPMDSLPRVHFTDTV